MMSEPIFSVLTGKGSLTVSGAGLSYVNGNYTLNGTYNGYNNYVSEVDSLLRIRVSSTIVNDEFVSEGWTIVDVFESDESNGNIYYSAAIAALPPTNGWYPGPGSTSAPAPTVNIS